MVVEFNAFHKKNEHMTKSNLPRKPNALSTTMLISLVFVFFIILLFTTPNFYVLAEDTGPTTTAPLFTQLASTAKATQSPTIFPTNTLLPTETHKPTSTATSTSTSTPTLTPTLSSTPTESTFTLFETNSTTPYTLLGLVIVISLLFLIILNARTEKIPFPSNPKLRINIDEKPRPIYKPVKNSEDITTQNQNELSDELINEFKLLRELYDITSKAQNDIFVSIHDLEILLKQKYPEKNVDLLRVAIEIANTQGGLLKIQQAREDFYLIQVL